MELFWFKHYVPEVCICIYPSAANSHSSTDVLGTAHLILEINWANHFCFYLCNMAVFDVTFVLALEQDLCKHWSCVKERPYKQNLCSYNGPNIKSGVEGEEDWFREISINA